MSPDKERILKSLARKAGTFQNVAERLGMPRDEAHRLIKQLEDAGRIMSTDVEKVKGVTRAIYEVSPYQGADHQTLCALEIQKVMSQWAGSATGNMQSGKAGGQSQNYSSTVHLIT